MKKLPFLIFIALIIISASICILVDFQKEAIIGSIIGFICSIAVAIESTNEKKHKSKLLCKEDYEEISIGEIIGIGIGIGVILALFAGFMFASPIGALFSFLGSVLGAIIGCMYHHDKK